ncbi:hypothetical protein MKW94_007214 [Papaver nudicaule]|uniref:MORF/ORRM1/DAG-like MORF domain-containing protein n=1 Tax=Papaver nudicaule TaxID=74823 RepID=A0AA41VU97_PAPNU|nr:hypothetical protein [Papaver nudicaule]
MIAMVLCRRGAMIIKAVTSSSSRSFITSSSSFVSSSSSRGVRPVAAVTEFTNRFPSTANFATATLKCMSRRTDTDKLNGCDFEHWFITMEQPQGEPTRDEIIATYINTLSKVLGSEEEARMKIYSVSTKHYFAFGALVSEELAYKMEELPGVLYVHPDTYQDVRNKTYLGEPFINGEAVPYDPKYHEEYIRNHNM